MSAISDAQLLSRLETSFNEAACYLAWVLSTYPSFPRLRATAIWERDRTRREYLAARSLRLRETRR